MCSWGLTSEFVGLCEMSVNPIDITVTGLKGNTLEVTLDDNATFDDLGQVLKDKWGIDTMFQRLCVGAECPDTETLIIAYTKRTKDTWIKSPLNVSMLISLDQMEMAFDSDRK